MAANLGMSVADSLIGPVVEEAGKGVVAVIKRQLNYLCCFDNNIQSFTEEAQELKNTITELQWQVDREKDNARVIVPQVEAWFESAENIQITQTEILNRIPNVQGSCLSILSRYSLSKKAKNTAEAMMDLRNRRRELVDIARDGPPPAQQPIPLEETHDFQSRKQIEESILNALTLAEGKNIIGICGVGGLGKTTMAKRIKHRMMAKGLVEEVVMVVVSQPVDMLRIQLEIAEQLGLKDIKDVDTLNARAHKLHERLKGPRRVLIVLDDIWEELNLGDLGIPNKTDSRSCIVLLTSRNEDTLGNMNAQVFGMQTLTPGEALSLFKDKSGIHVLAQNLMSLVEDVVKECQGLPIALVTLGTALKDAKEPSIWKDALDGLQASNPENLQPVLERVYKPLHLSYKFLKDEEAQSLFLLCSLFPEDFEVKFDYLTFYGMGLKMFKRAGTLHQARNRVHALVAKLRKRSLLLPCEEADRVRMHDVVRDVAIFIASQEGRVIKSGEHFDRNCEWISEFSKSRKDSLDHLMGSNYAKLCLMMIHLESVSSMGQKPLETNQYSVLEGKESLNVLSLKNFAFGFLPQSIELLKNLRTLRLKNCGLTSISIVGKLLNLEILVCRKCEEIEELPIEIGELTHLKLLHLVECNNLERIVPGVISKLVELEELKVLDCFKEWESLKELESLTKLTCLEIQILDIRLAEEEIHLSERLEKYKIWFGEGDIFLDADKALSLGGWRSEYNNLGSWIHKLALMIDWFYLGGNCPRNFDLSLLHNTVKTLWIEKCSMLEKLVKVSTEGVFPELEDLSLEDLPQLIQICDGRIMAGSNSFKNLKRLNLRNLPSLMHLLDINANQLVSFINLRQIDIRECNELQNLFLLERAEDVFSQLEKVTIYECERMEEVFRIELNGNIHHIKFSNLKELWLIDLPSLTTLVKGVESIEFPMLSSLKISSCPNLNRFVLSSGKEDSHNKDCSKLVSTVSLVEITNILIDEHNHDDESLHLFCNKQVKVVGINVLVIGGYKNVSNIWCQQISPYFFEVLKDLTIDDCTAIKSLFSTFIVENLVNLTSLSIKRCTGMEQVIADEDQEIKNTTIFPKLVDLELEELPLLGKFSEWKCEIEMPLLQNVYITRCSQMKFVTPGFVSTPHLKFIQVDDKGFDEDDITLNEIKDLNGFLCQLYLTSTKKMQVNMETEMNPKDGDDEHREDPH